MLTTLIHLGGEEEVRLLKTISENNVCRVFPIGILGLSGEGGPQNPLFQIRHFIPIARHILFDFGIAQNPGGIPLEKNSLYPIIRQ